MDAGFLITVEVGQDFMTKDTEDSSHISQIQWPVVSTHCKEHEGLSEPKGLDSREHQYWTRIGSYNLFPAR